MNNTQDHYGYIAIGLHWACAIVIFGLFGLGFWMVDLGYYDPWNKQGPQLHKSIGLILFVLMVVRLVWKWCQLQPQSLKTHSVIERKAGYFVHSVLYLLLFFIMSKSLNLVLVIFIKK